MSQENVEVIQRFHEAFNRSDFDEALEFAHPEIELYPAYVGLDVDSEYRGRDGVRTFLETIDDGFDTYTVAPEEMIEVGDDRVLVVERWTGAREASNSTWGSPMSTSSETGGVSGLTDFATRPKPSRPPGCRSRQRDFMGRTRLTVPVTGARRRRGTAFALSSEAAVRLDGLALSAPGRPGAPAPPRSASPRRRSRT
jgi:ketosteroid isomerase-like protein